MSICRFSECDVYLFWTADHHGGHALDCCGCSLRPGGKRWFATLDAALVHLQEHRDAGHDVPLWVDDTVRLEAPEWLHAWERP